MKYLLDTNLIAESGKRSPDPEVLQWLRDHERDCVPTAITAGELRYGLDQLPDGRKRRRLERWLGFLLDDLADSILPFDEWVAADWRRYLARLEHEGHSVRQLDLRDTQIAVTALHHNLAVVTRNRTHFPQVASLNPFSG